MHDQWDPVMVNVYLEEFVAGVPESAPDRASSRRRAVLSRTLAGQPTIDVRRDPPVIDLTGRPTG